MRLGSARHGDDLTCVVLEGVLIAKYPHLSDLPVTWMNLDWSLLVGSESFVCDLLRPGPTTSRHHYQRHERALVVNTFVSSSFCFLPPHSYEEWLRFCPPHSPRPLQRFPSNPRHLLSLHPPTSRGVFHVRALELA